MSVNNALRLSSIGAFSGGFEIPFTPTNNTWYHIAVTRQANVIRMFVDGVQGRDSSGNLLSTTDTTNFAYGNYLLPGDISNSAYRVRFDDFRVTIGSARYTADFTPPAEELPATNGDPYFASVQLLLQDSLLDESLQNQTLNSTNASTSALVVKYGSSSLEFTGGYLTNPQTGISLGNGDYTLEFWLYLNSTGTATRYIWDTANFGSSNYRPEIWVQSDTTMTLYAAGYRLDSNPVLSLAKWHHIALVRNGGVAKWYIDGQDETASLIGAEQDWGASAAGTIIGESYSGVNPLNGYIDSLRLTRGIARYTANFNPPIAAFPN